MKPVDRDTGHVDPYVPKSFSHGLGSPHTGAMPSHLSSPSVKGKKGCTRGRVPQTTKESIRPWVLSSFYSPITQPPKGSFSEHQPKFLFIASSTNKVDCHGRESSEPILCVGLVQHKVSEGLEVHLPVDRGECGNGISPSDRPTVRENTKPMVGIPSGRTFT